MCSKHYLGQNQLSIVLMPIEQNNDTEECLLLLCKFGHYLANLAEMGSSQMLQNTTLKKNPYFR